MVLKGQVFMLDVLFAFFVILLSFASFMSLLYLSDRTMTGHYREFITQKKLLDASEKLITIELADYSGNSLRHHSLSIDKIQKFCELGLDGIKRNLALDGYNISLKIGELLNEGNCSGMTVKRIALCGGNVCVLKICAE